MGRRYHGIVRPRIDRIRGDERRRKISVFKDIRGATRRHRLHEKGGWGKLSYPGTGPARRLASTGGTHMEIDG